MTALLRRDLGRLELAVAPHHDGDAEALGSKGALQVGLEVPAHDEQRLEAALAQMAADVGRIAAREAIGARPPGDVLKKAVGVARGQVHVPLEGRAEPRSRLLGRARAMGEEDMQVDRLRQLAKQRPVVLHRMRCQDGEAHGRCISLTPCPLAKSRQGLVEGGGHAAGALAGRVGLERAPVDGLRIVGGSQEGLEGIGDPVRLGERPLGELDHHARAAAFEHLHGGARLVQQGKHRAPGLDGLVHLRRRVVRLGGADDEDAAGAHQICQNIEIGHPVGVLGDGIGDPEALGKGDHVVPFRVARGLAGADEVQPQPVRHRAAARPQTGNTLQEALQDLCALGSRAPA